MVSDIAHVHLLDVGKSLVQKKENKAYFLLLLMSYGIVLFLNFVSDSTGCQTFTFGVCTSEP